MKESDNETHNSMSQKQKYIFYKKVESKYHDNLKLNCNLQQKKKETLRVKIENVKNETMANKTNLDKKNSTNSIENEISKIDFSDCEKLVYFISPNDENYLSYGDFTNNKYKKQYRKPTKGNY